MFLNVFLTEENVAIHFQELNRREQELDRLKQEMFGPSPSSPAAAAAAAGAGGAKKKVGGPPGFASLDQELDRLLQQV